MIIQYLPTKSIRRKESYKIYIIKFYEVHSNELSIELILPLSSKIVSLLGLCFDALIHWFYLRIFSLCLQRFDYHRYPVRSQLCFCFWLILYDFLHYQVTCAGKCEAILLPPMTDLDQALVSTGNYFYFLACEIDWHD